MSEVTVAGVGAYGSFMKDVPNDAKAAWEEALLGFLGVKYDPLVVSQQIVAGKNYKFVANATPTYPGAQTFGVVITINKPPDAKAHIQDINRI